jgi:hypothetical protein
LTAIDQKRLDETGVHADDAVHGLRDLEVDAH